MLLQGKNALITGEQRGIGAAMVLSLIGGLTGKSRGKA